MGFNSVGSSGLALINQAQARMAEAAEALSSGDGDFVQGVADLSRAKLEMQLGVKLARAADDALGTLLDILA
ncbi:MAG: hypothetical protein HZC36_06465 [Armatimonadetes bacterium]|nr:hypothetical protein [Armatimonadota bacterium]